MKNKKVFALIVSLVLIVGVVLPGTLAFSNEPAGQTQEAAAAADAKLTEEKTQEVKTEEVKTELPKAETPKAEAPKAETPKAETPKAQEPQCTCDPKPAEGQPHKDNCPVKLAADKAAAEKAAAEAKAKLEAEKAGTENKPNPNPEDKPATEQQPATEQKPTTEQQPATEPKPEGEQKPAEDKPCTCAPKPGEGEAHKEGCPLYVAPQKPAEEKSCTCEPKPAEGEAHKEGCPLYVAPQKPAEEKSCTCVPKPGEGETHKEGCPLYVAPEFDAAKAKAEILAMTSIEAVEQYLGGLTEEQRTAILDLFTVEEMEEFARSLGVVTEIEVVTPPANYTAVGPLMPAVATSTRARPRRAPGIATISEGGDQQGNGLELSKTASYDPVINKVTITLEAYTTGTVITSEKSTPVDIVMVLDESGSMKQTFSSSYQKVYASELDRNKEYYVEGLFGYKKVKWCTKCNSWAVGEHSQYTGHFLSTYSPKNSATDNDSEHTQFYEYVPGAGMTKKQALINAATILVNNVHDDANKNNVDHRISVIGFSGSSTVKVPLTTDIRKNKNDVISAIKGLKTDGGTYIEKGMNNAVTQFTNAPATSATNRKRVVIVFTDGIPGSGTWDWDTINNSANPAINHAKTLKNTYGATVYTIGVLDGADPTQPIDYGNSDNARTNRFLHFLSSNYPNATNMSSSGTGSNKGYYLTANNADTLNDIFKKISETIATPTIQLESSTQVRDYITPQFTAPANANDVKLYTAEYDGTTFGEKQANPAGVTATIDPTDGHVTVTGFDYNANFVSKTAKEDGTHGKKLIIEFTVTPKDGFLGGNNVTTNGEASGVYAPGADTATGTFTVPTVNVPIKDVTVTAEDKNVYLLGGVTAEQLKAGATVKVGDVDLKLNEANYGLETWQTEYVNITTSITDKDGNPIPANGLTGLTEDTTYTVKVTVAPTTEADAGSASPATMQEGQNNPAAKINVFKPELTFKDSEGYYGDTAPQLTDNLTKTEWKHPTATGDILGTAPNLDTTYDFAGGTINTKEDIPVKAVVKIDNVDVTQYTTFQHQPCTSDCSWQSPANPGNPAFLIHVKTCQLTVKKSSGANNEPYVFNVLKDSKKYTEVTIEGNGTQTIVELPVGTYTIQEDTGWSWRYPNPNYSASVTLSKDSTDGTITCTNNKTLNKWLNGFSAVKQNIFKQTATNN